MTRKSKYRILYVSAAAAVIALIFLYAGNFLFSNSGSPPIEIGESEEGNSGASAIEYKHIESEINGYEQKINMLKVDLRNKGITIKPALSFNEIYGYETLSKIVERNNAHSAINAGFFHEYGNPSGMVVIDGKLISNSTGKYPVFVIKDDRAEFKEIETGLWIEYGGKSLDIDNINAEGKPGQVVLYTPEYGRSNRADSENISVTVENGMVKEVDAYAGDVHIPPDGMLITFYGITNRQDIDVAIKAGEAVQFKYSSGNVLIDQAYECGSWVVRDGHSVVKEKDEWIGIMTNRDPRTVIGLKDDHTVVLITIDGRQPGYSYGLTARELAGLLLSFGVDNAAMLDGGASTEMILGGRMVNRPSFKGQERPVGGGIVLCVEGRPHLP